MPGTPRWSRRSVAQLQTAPDVPRSGMSRSAAPISAKGERSESFCIPATYAFAAWRAKREPAVRWSSVSNKRRARWTRRPENRLDLRTARRLWERCSGPDLATHPTRGTGATKARTSAE